MNENSLYNTSEEIEAYKQKISASKRITRSNKKAIFDFLKSCENEGLGSCRISMYAQRLYASALLLGKDFKKAKREDFEAFSEKLRSQTVTRRGETVPLSEETVNLYRITLRKFYKWFEGKGEEYPDKIRWWKSRKGNCLLKIKPEDLLTSDEIQQLINASQNDRDRALISVLAEGGFRIGEINSMTIGSITYDEIGVRVTVQGKTGQRTTRLIQAVNHLTNWLASHPHKDQSSAPLWCGLRKSNFGKPLPYATYRVLLLRIAKRAGVNKRVNPHAFRHYAGTKMFKLGLPTEIVNSFMGWAPGTKMARVYAHIAGKDVDDALLQAYGLRVKQDDGEVLRCPRCAGPNDVTQQYCGKCGAPLTVKASVQIDHVQDNAGKIALFMEKIEPLMELLENNAELRSAVKHELLR